ncbi:MAG: DUF5686 family protein [Bacteroidota bacterium]
MKTHALPSFVVFLFTLLSLSSFAQQTVVSGQVFDAKTKESLPLVTLHFQDTKIGLNADADGKFQIATYYATDTLVFNFIGYKPKKIRIKKDQAQEVQVFLEPSTVGLQEVVIRYDKEQENPAHPIIRRVIANKKVNDREKLQAYQYEAYNKVEFDLNNLSDEFKNRKIIKPFKFVFDHIDSSGEKAYLPIFITEAISDFYYRKSPKSSFENIKATKVSGVENESVSQFLGDMYQNLNVYDNNIIAFGRSFISPISNNGFIYYKYFLTDSLYIGDSYCYQIEFKPRRKQEPTFEGTLWINDTTYAVKKLEASIAEDANINFIKKFFVEQEFEQVEKEVWMLKKDKLVVDFNLTKGVMGLYGRKTSTYRNHVINKELDSKFYNNKDNINLAADFDKKSTAYWDTARHEELSVQEKAIYTMVDSIKNVPQFRTFIDVLNFLINGYEVLGNFEIGPYFTFYSFNPVEGNRLRFGGRTSNAFSKRILLEGYGAYGFRDERFKYGGGFTYILSKQPRTAFSGYAKQDVEQLGQSQNALRNDNVLSSFFRRNPARKLTLTEEYRSEFEHEWFTGFSNKISFRWRAMRPLGILAYEKYNEQNQLVQIPSIKTAEVGLYTRFAFKERFVYGEFERVSLGTDYPILELQYSKSMPGIGGTFYNYQKLVAGVEDELKLGIFGRTEYRFEAGKVFGTAPYPLLEIHKGNETFFYDDYAFNSMNFFEFVSDEYASAFVTHHFDGFFLNRFPLLRKLKWREVASVKAVVGHYNDANSRDLILTDNIYTLNRGPFLEAAVGIENIFKFVRIDGLYRLRYLDHPNIVKFGIRIKLQFEF